MKPSCIDVRFFLALMVLFLVSCSKTVKVSSNPSNRLLSISETVQCVITEAPGKVLNSVDGLTIAFECSEQEGAALAIECKYPGALDFETCYNDLGTAFQGTVQSTVQNTNEGSDANLRISNKVQVVRDKTIYKGQFQLDDLDTGNYQFEVRARTQRSGANSKSVQFSVDKIAPTLAAQNKETGFFDFNLFYSAQDEGLVNSGIEQVLCYTGTENQSLTYEGVGNWHNCGSAKTGQYKKSNLKHSTRYQTILIARDGAGNWSTPINLESITKNLSQASTCILSGAINNPTNNNRVFVAYSCTKPDEQIATKCSLIPGKSPGDEDSFSTSNCSETNFSSGVLIDGWYTFCVRSHPALPPTCQSFQVDTVRPLLSIATLNHGKTDLNASLQAQDQSGISKFQCALENLDDHVFLNSSSRDLENAFQNNLCVSLGSDEFKAYLSYGGPFIIRGKRYRLHARTFDLSGLKSDTVTRDFQIVPFNSIDCKVLGPLANNFVGESQPNIKFLCMATLGISSLNCNLINKNTAETLHDGECSSNNSFKPTVALIGAEADEFLFTVTARGEDNVSSVASSQFRLDVTPPTIALSEPNTSPNYLNFPFNISDAGSGVNENALFCELYNSNDVKVSVENCTISGAQISSTGLDKSVRYYLKIGVSDKLGNQSHLTTELISAIPPYQAPSCSVLRAENMPIAPLATNKSSSRLEISCKTPEGVDVPAYCKVCGTKASGQSACLSEDFRLCDESSPLDSKLVVNNDFFKSGPISISVNGIDPNYPAKPGDSVNVEYLHSVLAPIVNNFSTSYELTDLSKPELQESWVLSLNIELETYYSAVDYSSTRCEVFSVESGEKILDLNPCLSSSSPNQVLIGNKATAPGKNYRLVLNFSDSLGNPAQETEFLWTNAKRSDWSTCSVSCVGTSGDKGRQSNTCEVNASSNGLNYCSYTNSVRACLPIPVSCADSCRADQVLLPDDSCGCSDAKEEIGGQCVPLCSAGYTRSQSGDCQRNNPIDGGWSASQERQEQITGLQGSGNQTYYKVFQEKICNAPLPENGGKNCTNDVNWTLFSEGPRTQRILESCTNGATIESSCLSCANTRGMVAGTCLESCRADQVRSPQSPYDCQCAEGKVDFNGSCVSLAAKPIVSLLSPISSPGKSAFPQFTISSSDNLNYSAGTILSLHKTSDCSDTPIHTIVLSNDSDKVSLEEKIPLQANTNTVYRARANGNCGTSSVSYSYDGSGGKIVPIAKNRDKPESCSGAVFYDQPFSAHALAGTKDGICQPEDYSHIATGSCTAKVSFDRDCFHSGSGSKEDPYLVCTFEQFSRIAKNPSASYKLGRTLDASNASPGANPTTMPGGLLTGYIILTGVLDGNGFKIKNLQQSGSANKNLFKMISGCGVKNLSLENLDYSDAGTSLSAGLLAEFVADATIVGVELDSNSSIKTSSRAGTLIGSVDRSTLSHIHSAAAFNGVSSFNGGGLIGTGGLNVFLNNVSYTGRISVPAKENLTGVVSFGGIIGNAPHAVISNAYTKFNFNLSTARSDYRVNGDLEYIGGIAGYAKSISKSTSEVVMVIDAMNIVQAGEYIGGLAGAVTDVKNSRSIGALSINCFGTQSCNNFGGLVGYLSGTVEKSYADVSFKVECGGIQSCRGFGGLVGYDSTFATVSGGTLPAISDSYKSRETIIDCKDISQGCGSIGGISGGSSKLNNVFNSGDFKFTATGKLSQSVKSICALSSGRQSSNVFSAGTNSATCAGSSNTQSCYTGYYSPSDSVYSPSTVFGPAWDFVNVWQQTGGLPLLRGF